MKRKWLKTAAFLTAFLMLAGMVLAGSAEPAEEADDSQIAYDMVRPYYDDSVQAAELSPDLGRNFTDHKIDHAVMVMEKSAELFDAVPGAVEAGTLPVEVPEGMIGFSGDLDPDVLVIAALFHDTGMSGLGYAPVQMTDSDGDLLYDDNGRVMLLRDNGHVVMLPEDLSDFQTIRTYHSLNSCLFLLICRDVMKEAGYSDQDVDMMAAACQAHSKSSSGVRNLNSKADWSYAFDLIDDLVYAWNTDNPEDTISFDRTPFETDDEVLRQLASVTLSLRVADVSRDSGPDAEVQTGETVHVDRSTLNNFGGYAEAELKDAVIVIGEENEPVETFKSRQVHVGEQNISENHCSLNKDGFILHEITVIDGCSAPRCTQMSINDHLGEFYSAREGRFAVSILFQSFEDTDDGYFRDSWESYRIQAAQDYPNVTVFYPWDEEETP